MNNVITVQLDNRRYRIVAEESPDYMQEIAAYVNLQLAQVRKGDPFRSGVDCATLTALNLADTLYKERAATEDLRLQLKQALDELHSTEQRLRELKRGQKLSPQRKLKKGPGQSVSSTQMSIEDSTD